MPQMLFQRPFYNPVIISSFDTNINAIKHCFHQKCIKCYFKSPFRVCGLFLYRSDAFSPFKYYF